MNEDKDPLIWVWREQEDKVAEAGGASEVWKLNDYEYSKEDSLRFRDWNREGGNLGRAINTEVLSKKLRW